MGHQLVGQLLDSDRAQWRPAGRRGWHRRERRRPRANNRTGRRQIRQEAHRGWQHLRSGLDKVRKPRVLLCLHHVQACAQHGVFDVVAELAFNHRRPHGQSRSALQRAQHGFCVEHYLFERWVRGDDEEKNVPDGGKLCADRTEARGDAERPGEGERARRGRDAERKVDRLLQSRIRT